MSAQLLMFDLPICPATRNATSLRELASGLTHSGKLAGQTTSQSGPEAAPASHSAVRTQSMGAAESKTSDIFGHTGRRSSQSANLQSSLENRLQTRLPVDGWTKSLTIWSDLITPLGRPLCRLSVSARHRNACVFGLYATPTTSDYKGSVSLKRSLERMAESQRGVRLPEQVIRIEEKDGLLNPAFACWLMGLPPMWDVCGAMATPSSARLPRRSSKAHVKP